MNEGSLCNEGPPLCFAETPARSLVSLSVTATSR